jgi:hypothetical protein
MTHDVLQSDIDLARKLIKEERQETEIIAALGLRGLEPTTATRLLDDLRNGRVADQPIQLVRRSSRKIPVLPGEFNKRKPRRPSKPPTRWSQKGRSVGFWVVVVCIVLSVLGAGAFVFYELSHTLKSESTYSD